MILQRKTTKKSLAALFLFLWASELLLPLYASALTSGPKQPEHTQFQPAGTADMVNLFTGAFKYNVPLLDVDGFPVNLNYASGAGIDEEASWVGLGWNLSTGAINRQLRGVPDDMNGDNILTDHYTADNITVGGRVTARVEVVGGDIGKLSGSLSIGIFCNNYTGFGAEVGANSGLTLGGAASGGLTAGLKYGVTSSTSDGVTIDAGTSLQLQLDKYARTSAGMGLSSNLSYNTREGLKSMTLGKSFSLLTLPLSATDTRIFNTPPFSPKINMEYQNTSASFSSEVGGVYYAIYGSQGMTGFMNKQSLISRYKSSPSFGFLYADKGSKKKNAVMDFFREKDNPVIPKLPNLPVTSLTPDVFSFESQGGSGQFRLHGGGSAVVFDAYAEDRSADYSSGSDVGIGGYAHGGVSIYNQQVSNKSGKWINENNFLNIGDYKNDAANPGEEAAYFKVDGELVASEAAWDNKVQGDDVVSVPLNGNGTFAQLKNPKTYATSAGTLKKETRQIRNTAVSFLTNKEAYASPVNRVIPNYPLLEDGFKPVTCSPAPAQSISRLGGYRQGHHISMFTVTSSAGARSVYGIPVYNISQDEYTVAADPSREDHSQGLVGISTTGDKEDILAYSKATDQFYHHDKQPAYAATYLLSAMYSPDYVDVTNNGITDDDPGNAVKFNYSRLTDKFRWRTPMSPGNATLHRGLNADPEDDRANIVTGTKELWYLHSIETKTKIAYFITADRNDALGVKNLYGDVDASLKQRYLKKIVLYSKSDLTKPIKTVVLEYDQNYPVCPGTPNSMENKGKLTLQRVYFQYASSTKGKYHKYEFEYNNSGGYGFLQSDKWGNYKPLSDNQNTPFSQMRNDEFPYVIQDASKANSNAKGWNLKRISLPSGGVVDIDYESGDYAYVQDRKAMAMVKVLGFIQHINDNLNRWTLQGSHGVRVAATGTLRGTTDQERLRYFIADYLGGRNEFYTRLKINVTDKPNTYEDSRCEIIPSYSEVTAVKDNGDGSFNIIVKDVTAGGVTASPFQVAAWQRMRLDYPMYAYPGYKNRIKSSIPIIPALSALVNAIGNLAEIRMNFNERAKKRGFCNDVDLSRSFARLVKADGHKYGGAARVKSIRISDEWNTMTGNNGANAAYGQAYSYTINEDGKEISSGVAAYEPYVGGDENPLRMPVPYNQASRGALTNYYYLEEPFGESLYPGASVGYRCVSVRDLDANGAPDPAMLTGRVQHEFYTAKDYPVIVKQQERPEVRQVGPSGKASFAKGSQIYQLVMSQGYVVMVNDMHGKPKAERVFNRAGAEISSVVSYYKSDPLDGDKLQLNNKVTTVDENGSLHTAEVLGREVELVTDVREAETSNIGTSIQIGMDVIPILWFAIPIPHWPRNENDSYRLFRSASTLKVIEQTGILDHVVKTINGSSATTTNLVFDRNTGAPIVTSTTNEFNDPVYSITMPAYWKYASMGGAYKNINTVITNFQTNANGVITSTGTGILKSGDELLSLSDGQRYWVINTALNGSGVPALRLINATGNIVASYNGSIKIVRSGYRNLTDAGAESIVCLKNPVAGNRLQVLTGGDLSAYKVINASAVLYEEEWGAKQCNCPEGYIPSSDGTTCYKLADFDSDSLLELRPGAQSTAYGQNGVIWDGSGLDIQNDYWGGACTSTPYCGKLNNVGIWIKEPPGNPNVNKWMVIETCIDLPYAGTYGLGFGFDDIGSISIDGTVLLDTAAVVVPNADTYNYWHLQFVNIPAGKHTLRIATLNGTGNGTCGVELYQATPEELLTSILDINSTIVFSTADLLRGKPYNTMIYSRGWVLERARYRCGPLPAAICGDLICDSTSYTPALNPYVAGMLGNWRVAAEKTYLVNRNDQGIAGAKQETGWLRTGGYYNSFQPYWYFDIVNGGWIGNNTDSHWITSRYVTSYDKYGQEQENKDALLRYSSALYGYKGSMSTAVASNAMRREVFYDGFEDYNYNTLCSVGGNCAKDNFSIPEVMPDYSNCLNSSDAHSGNYCFKLNRRISLSAPIHSREHEPGYGKYMDIDAQGQYRVKVDKNLYPAGFQPMPNKSYVFSVWVKDNQPAADIPYLPVYINDEQQPISHKATVEGWKLVEIEFKTDATGIFNLVIGPAGNMLIDDIRIYPVDAVVQTYAYDAKTLRLMGTMDENNFATFYEYDDEGVLIRVKKETDRGIMTLKETRTVLKKN
ncbi:hypothetical protein SAMN05444266_10590 [Chitinophaga jiangningensis]|uniref:Uncharacterized protein n=1 Tax=Chitinophaga jiangningensis TaxID=1419482 RepID=A0A1M7DQ88_9BACT|nr:hypothetical protein [Chitinophaga jiangningensis]SHL81660.1 hypothetical protein SAMN05444266_10590 [Chitinophaga jiangningensis]